MEELTTFELVVTRDELAASIPRYVRAMEASSMVTSKIYSNHIGAMRSALKKLNDDLERSGVSRIEEDEPEAEVAVERLSFQEQLARTIMQANSVHRDTGISLIAAIMNVAGPLAGTIIATMTMTPATWDEAVERAGIALRMMDEKS